MKSSKKVGIIVLVLLGMSIFGYLQYASASQISANISKSELLDETENGSNYNVELRFENPSLLIMTAGETEFFVIDDDEIIGKGQLEPFTLYPLDHIFVRGSFHTDSKTNEESQLMKITGVTKYDLGVALLDVPFTYYPTQEQAREFIHQN
ncbi:MAG: hypothetical protein OEY17_04050 [Nitrosopumilus sp.]|nr:hypothetical protein [Nitrosopumilus sp.]